MDARTTSLEEFLVAVLRGAAKLLGCDSTNLIVINEKAQEIRIRLGTTADSYPIIAEVDRMLGGDLRQLCFPVAQARTSLVYRAWRDRRLFETSSIGELVGDAFAPAVVEQLGQLVGEQRFICVPALSVSRNYGVLLFQKVGRHPFSRQQREVILRYARRIGEILENDLLGQGQTIFSRLPRGGPDYLLLSEHGDLLGQSTGHHPSDPEEAARVDQLTAQVRAFLRSRPDGGDEAAAETVARLHLGGGRHVDLVPFESGGRRHLLCVSHDPRQRPERSLENQLLQLTLGDTVPALFVDPALRITSCNEATLEVLGYQPSELCGVPLARIFHAPEEVVPLIGQPYVDPRGASSLESAILLRKDGSLTAARVEALLLASEKQQAVGFLLLLREDVEGGLGEGAPESTDRLVCQERLASLGEMAAQLAHELRNPLVAIGATLEMLQRDQAVPGEQRRILASVTREILRMDMTLKDCLAFGRDFSLAEVAIAGLVDDARRVLEGAYRLAGKRIATAVDPGLRARLDYDAMKHVLFNLLLNALEASPPDGQVTCSATLGAHDLAIVIEDQGPGLCASPAECLRPFFTTKQNGTGLGLSVCQKIVRAHGGLLELGNREAGGCRVRVLLPRPLASKVAAGAGPSTAASAAASLAASAAADGLVGVLAGVLAENGGSR